MVVMPGAKAPPRPKTDAELAKTIRAAYSALCRAIDAATEAGLQVRCTLDAKDVYGGGLAPKVRGRDIEITRKI